MQNREPSNSGNFLESYMQSWNALLHATTSDQDSGHSGTDTYPFGSGLEQFLQQFGEANNLKVQTLLKDQMAAMQRQVQLWQTMSASMTEEIPMTPVITEDPADRRFSDPQWTDNPLYSYIKQSYLLHAQLLNNIVDSLEFDDDRAEERAKFLLRQYINAAAPTNFPLTNPEVQALTLEARGQNLARGMENFTRDVQRSPLEVLKITQSDPTAFELGKTLATTKGKVIFQNEVMQLIQYNATTEKVFAKPLLIIPPFINKFYILDLDKTKSMVRWLVAKGFTVFLASWVNPDSSLAGIGFEDYIMKGVIQSVDVVADVCKSKHINAAGYCSGGTLLAVAQALLRARGDERITSCTLIATQTDFSDPGGLGVYLTDDLIPFLQQHTNLKGIFDGRILGTGFNLLRENSLYWSYYVDNYLKGKQPKAFDILHWNSDSTNIPAKTMSYYLRKMYMENSLVEPDALVVDGQGIDIARIDTPTYFIATSGDHIVPCTASYRSSKYFGGPVRYVLGESGHIAGVINPEATGKYNHWVNDKPSPDFDTWKKGSTLVKGSWWTDWGNWLEPQSGRKIVARKIGNSKYKPIENAPGSYVKVCI